MMGKVPTFSPGSAVSSALPSYLMLCLALQVPRLVSAQFTVTGPDGPITASLGGEAVLPCHLSPQMSAENMEVRWFRSQLSEVVHLYHDGQDQFGEQMLEFQGRTELVKDDITTGSVSLRIRDIRPSDNGRYTCFFQSSVSSDEVLLELRVADLGSDPDISVEGPEGGGIRLVCRSSGWFPEPKPEWRDQQGQLLPSASESTSQEARGLFQTEIATILTEESSQNVSCHVRNPRLNQERESVISIAELFFPRVSPWMVALGMILALLVFFIALASYCFWRQHEEKETLQSAQNCEKETLLSDRGREKEALQAEMERQKETLLSAMERQKAEYEAAKELGLSRAQGYAVDVMLDPDTANRRVVLSEDRKRVKLRNTVLGNKGFAGGRHYWEVEVGNKTAWTLGVCRESVSREGLVTLSPKIGYWVVWLRDGGYEAHASPSCPLPMSTRPSRVGVFLDYEAGEVSFYNVTDRSHLFTFTDTFSGTLCLYFDTDCNAAPLTICPVPAQPGGNPCP